MRSDYGECHRQTSARAPRATHLEEHPRPARNLAQYQSMQRECGLLHVKTFQIQLAVLYPSAYSIPSTSITGRISIEPCLAPGILAAISIASSRSLQSSK